MKKNETELTYSGDEIIQQKIFYIRNQKVMMDSDLATLYGVETRVLKQAVRRNIKRFPEDFMFELTKEEVNSLRSQFVTLKRGAHSKFLPFAFTEHGVLMISSVLNSERAIEVNIRIMRIFTRLRELLLSHKDLLLKMEKFETELSSQGKSIKIVFDYLNQFIRQQEQPRPKVGFKRKGEE